MKRVFAVAVAWLVMLSCAPPVLAAPVYPSGAVRLVVPFPPGGPTDTLARILADGLQQRWKQPVIVENRPGAGTVIGIDHVAKSEPDGRTLGIVISGYTINPAIRRQSMPYDTLKDLQGITQLAESRLAMVARADAPFNTVSEFIEQAKRNPGKMTYASPGAGTSTHLAGELFKNAAQIDIVHVPYKGSAPAQTDLIGGQVDIMFDLVQSALPMVQTKRLKIIAVASSDRDPGLPGVPAVSETLRGVVVGSMFGLVTNAKTPPDVVRKIRDAVADVLASPKVHQSMAELGMVIVASTPEDFNAYLKSEVEKWQSVVDKSGIRLE